LSIERLPELSRYLRASRQEGKLTMTSIKIETVTDAASGQVYAEVYMDDDAKPIMRSEAAFASHDDLVQEVLEMCRDRFPDHSPFADDPTIGV
jgi:hypothetical protein